MLPASTVKSPARFVPPFSFCLVTGSENNPRIASPVNWRLTALIAVSPVPTAERRRQHQAS